jgi:hypothetical protein
MKTRLVKEDKPMKQKSDCYPFINLFPAGDYPLNCPRGHVLAFFIECLRGSMRKCRLRFSSIPAGQQRTGMIST